MPEVKGKLKNGPGARPGCPERYLQDGHERLLRRSTDDGERRNTDREKGKRKETGGEWEGVWEELRCGGELAIALF